MIRFTTLTRPIAWIALAAVVPSPLVAGAAQPDHARMTGRVTDGSGAALPGATVTIRSASGTTATVITDGVGQFLSPPLPEGAYTVGFELAGFELRTRPGIAVRGGDVLILDQQLGLASLAETVQVVADAPAPPAPEPPPPPAPAPVVRLAAPRRPETTKVPAELLASVCGPGKAGDASITIGHLIAHREEPNRQLYGRGDVLVLDVGQDLGIEVGQNLVVRRRVRAGGGSAAARSIGEQTAGLVQVVETSPATSVAVVVYACGELFAGDGVEPFDALPMWTSQAMLTPQYDDPAHVILGDHGQTLGAERSLMVIDRGATRGAERGQRLTIFRRTLGEEGPRLTIADAVIVAVRAESATIRIERASDAVSVGDMVALHR